VVLCTVIDSARYGLLSVALSVGILIPEPESPYVTLLIVVVVVVVVVVVTVVKRRSGIDCWVRVHGTPVLDGCLTGRRRRSTLQDALPGKWMSLCLFSSAFVSVSIYLSWTRTRCSSLQHLPRDCWLSCLQHLTLSDPTSDLVRQYDFAVMLRCRKTSDTVFVAFVRPLSESVRRFSSCSTDFSQQIVQVVLFLYLHVFLF
jgi:hypothetical protein